MFNWLKKIFTFGETPDKSTFSSLPPAENKTPMPSVKSPKGKRKLSSQLPKDKQQCNPLVKKTD